MLSEYGMILMYIGAFGISDIIVEWVNLNTQLSFIYYFLLLAGGSYIYYSNY
jgi:hypothetical protein